MAELAEVFCAPGTLVVGDLHLDVFELDGPRAFAAWLDGLRGTPRLVVLGDLFEFWAGRGQEREPGAKVVVDALARRVAGGTDVDLLPGNRDFLLGPAFAAASGVRLHTGGLLGRLEGGARTLFVHGDELCTADAAYLRYRRAVRSPLFRSVLACTPFALRRRLALRLRRRSAASTAAKPDERRGQRPEAVRELVERTGADALICGHAHRFRDEDLGGGRRWLVIDGWGGERDALALGPRGHWEPRHAAAASA